MKKDPFYYQDTNFGFNPFIGEEIVFWRQKLIWSMNYYGRVFIKKKSAKDIYIFLKKALREVVLIKPYRGPRVYKNSYLKYANKTEGSISDFKGCEKIYYKNRLVYILNYHGGVIKEDC